MNTRSFGPALTMAPDAKCDDGLLDVVLVRPGARRSLSAHLKRAAEKGDIALPAFETIRAKQVRIRADGRWANIDAVTRQLEGEVRVEAATHAVKILAPPQSPVQRTRRPMVSRHHAPGLGVSGG